jgi:hypothetical protein
MKLLLPKAQRAMISPLFASLPLRDGSSPDPVAGESEADDMHYRKKKLNKPDN